MTRPSVDWNTIYQQDTLPPYSIGEPQPELAAIIDQGRVRSDVLDAGCGHAALSLALAAQGHTVVGLDISPFAVAAATATAAERGLTTVTFAEADLTEFSGYDGRFNTVMDSGCLHSLPVDRRQSYLRSIHRAAAPGARLFILAFSIRAYGEASRGPNGFSGEELRDTVGTLWTVNEVRPAKLYANDTQLAGAPATGAESEHTGDGRLAMPGFLVSAHKAGS